MRESMIPVTGGQLHLVDEGEPGLPTILLIHAGIADLRAWDDLVPLLVEGGYRVARFDMRGHGATETRDVEFSNRLDVIAILDVLEVQQAALVGNSRGGAVAFDTAVEFPARVAAVVGVAAGLGGYLADITPEEEALFEQMEGLEGADPPDAEAIADLDVRVWVDGPGQPPTRLPARLRDAVREMDVAVNAPGRLAGKPVRLDPPAADRLADLTCPVLVIAGELDVSEVAHTARYVVEHAPNASLELWPDVAHMIGMEVPERLADRILEFLDPLPRWS